MFQIREVLAAECIPQFIGVLRENWAETGFDFDLALDVEMYRALQASGLWFAVGAFLGDELVGYSSAAVAPHPFNPSVVCCSSDALFVRKPHRGGTLPLRLIRETERIAKERGASRMLWHARAGTSFAEILARRGYAPADTVLMKGI